MSRGLIVPCTRTRRSIAQLSVSVPSNNIQFSVDFTTNIAESNFWYTHASAINKRARAIDFEQDALLCRSGWLSPKALCKLAIFFQASRAWASMRFIIT
jgi:hypothetical protein